MIITPEYLARNGSEDGEHSAIIQAVMMYIYPTYNLAELIYHTPNGGARGSSRAEGQRNGARMQALGTKAGVPDICLPIASLGYGALYIEVKKPDGKGSLEHEQVDRLVRLCTAGNMCAVVDDWKAGYALIHAYLTTPTRSLFDSHWCSTTVQDLQGNTAILCDFKGYFAKYHKSIENSKNRRAKKAARNNAPI